MSLADYGGESLIRMVALICFDGLIPLGPDFILKAQSNLSQSSPSDFQQNPVFKQMEGMIPGGNTAGKLGFIGESFSSISGWMGNFVASKGLTPQNVMRNLQTVVEVSADKFDYVAGFLDMSTNYYYHTGVQTLARRLIERASAEI